MSKVCLEVNGRPVQHDVPDRTHLGDFLRDQVRLTGTHLGCEHGVCGACTVLLDGEPVRSCITFAVACEGRRITTVEGYDADPVMALLRPAFTRHHALQCGFCTPGMLATARDIVLRLPDADEERVRVELAGNLCRCTGYMGIVAAVLSVLEALRREPVPEVQGLRRALREGRGAVTPASPPARKYVGFEPAVAADATVGANGRGNSGANPVAATGANARGNSGANAGAPAGANTGANPGAAAAVPAEGSARAGSAARGKGSRIDGHFDVPFPAAQVWAFMVDLPAVAACLPGAAIESQEGDRVKGKVAVKFGPMSAAFNGAARLDRDDAAMSAVLRGAGQDSLSQSRATGDIAYRVEPLPHGHARVQVELLYSLQGPLAQFSRSGLVKDFVRRMIVDFGRNVARRLEDPAGAGQELPAGGFSPGRMFFSVAWQRIRRLLGRR